MKNMILVTMAVLLSAGPGYAWDNIPSAKEPAAAQSEAKAAAEIKPAEQKAPIQAPQAESAEQTKQEPNIIAPAGAEANSADAQDQLTQPDQQN